MQIPQSSATAEATEAVGSTLRKNAMLSTVGSTKEPLFGSCPR